MWRVGDVTVHRVEENCGPSAPVSMILPSWDPAVVDDLGPATIDRSVDPSSGMAILSTHTWVVTTPDHTILVDTCVGNHKQRSLAEVSLFQTDWLDRLAASGVRPDEVDAVVCTHLHIDHVGWNTSLVGGEWVPTFPNARYYVNATEFDFWNPAVDAHSPTDWEAHLNLNVFDDSLLPVFDRGLVELWRADGYQIDDCFRLVHLPGHTPGHSIGWIESRGERALLSGDAMHSALQAHVPEWNSGFCHDPALAVTARRHVLEHAVELGALMMPAHFTAPHAFRVAPRDDGFTLLDA